MNRLTVCFLALYVMFLCVYLKTGDDSFLGTSLLNLFAVFWLWGDEVR